MDGSTGTGVGVSVASGICGNVSVNRRLLVPGLCRVRSFASTPSKNIRTSSSRKADDGGDTVSKYLPFSIVAGSVSYPPMRATKLNPSGAPTASPPKIIGIGGTESNIPGVGVGVGFCAYAVSASAAAPATTASSAATIPVKNFRVFILSSVTPIR